MKDVDLERLISRIQQLYQERQELLAGSLSPVGAWIHTYEIRRQYSQSSDVETYCYAKWQAHDPIGRVLDLWKGSNGSTKLVAIDKQPNNNVV